MCIRDGHRTADERNPVLVEARTRFREVVDLDRDVIGEAHRRTRSRVRPTRTSRRLGLDEEVELVVTDLEPGASEPEVVWAWHFLEAESITVEAARRLEIGDDQPA